MVKLDLSLTSFNKNGAWIKKWACLICMSHMPDGTNLNSPQATWYIGLPVLESFSNELHIYNGGASSLGETGKGSERLFL